MEEILKSYAKVNIGLRILQKREDGYHNIDSYFHLIDLYDEIAVSVKPSNELVIRIKGNDGYLDKGMDIMEKAARVFSKETGHVFSLSISIKKNIPSKAGLGGGSSNGAAVLRFLNRCYCECLSDERLMMLALFVGSDLPFFISGLRSARVMGRGEIIKPCSLLSGIIDLYCPSFYSQTSEAYAKLDTLDRSYCNLPDSLGPLTNESYPNDFELITPRNDLIQNISRNYTYFSLSGSGSTYFGIGKKDGKEPCKSDMIRTIRTVFV